MFISIDGVEKSSFGSKIKPTSQLQHSNPLEF